MDDKRSTPTGRLAVLHSLGGPPGRYVVASMALAVLWFPFRVWLDRGQPMSEIVAGSGLFGAMWALFTPAAEWMQRHGRRAGNSSVQHGDSVRHSPATSPHGARRAWARRGAYIGLAVGVPFHGGLILLCLRTGAEAGYPITFGVILFVTATISITNLLRNAAAPDA